MPDKASLNTPAKTSGALSVQQNLLARVLVGVSGLFFLGWPFLVWLGLKWIGPAGFSAILLLVVLIRLWVMRKNLRVMGPIWILSSGLAVLLALWAWLAGGTISYKLYPLCMSIIFFGFFFSSLWRGQTAVERIARLTDPNLPPEGVAYTRKVTWVWCGFFVLNGGVALYTALYTTEAIWALYNGLLSYLLIGLLFGVEYLFRLRFRRKHELVG